MEVFPTVDQIEQRVQALPLIDSHVGEVLRLLDDPESNFDQVARSLSPGLATRFLQIANTDPDRKPVHSIGLAVKLLGYRKMRETLKAAIAVDHFTRRLENFDFDRYLSQARFCAAVAGLLGDILHYDRSGDLFTVATLQNIGKLVIAVYFEDHHRRIVALKQREHLPTSVAERRIIGISHGEIGALVLRRFSVPPEICEAVRLHDRHVPLDDGRSLSELQLIARQAATLVSRFRLPTDFDPAELPQRLEAAVAAGRRLHQQLVQVHIRSGGYERVLPEVVEQLGQVVAIHLRRQLPLRPAAPAA